MTFVTLGPGVLELMPVGLVVEAKNSRIPTLALGSQEAMANA